MQTIVQVTIYREKAGKYEYLLLKRADTDEPFWQPISQASPSHKDDAIAQTLKKALADEAGIQGFRHFDKEIFTYDWYSHGEHGRDIVFSGEVDAATAIFPDLTKYSVFEWLPANEARLRLKWDGNKQAIRELQDRLEARQTTAQEAARKGIHDTRTVREEPGVTDLPAGIITNHTHGTGDSHTTKPRRQPPKRLPDEEPPRRDDDDDYSRRSTVFPL